MGAGADAESLADLLSNPNFAQTINEALSNPQVIDMMIASNPALRNLGPEARQIFQSPEFRSMMTNPQMVRQAAQMQRLFGGGMGGQNAFPAPGETDQTPSDANNPSGGNTATPNQPNAK